MLRHVIVYHLLPFISVFSSLNAVLYGFCDFLKLDGITASDKLMSFQY